MWHFGYDSYSGYTSKKFEVSWEDGQNSLFRIYAKDRNGVTKITREHQIHLPLNVCEVGTIIGGYFNFPYTYTLVSSPLILTADTSPKTQRLFILVCETGNKNIAQWDNICRLFNKSIC
jgi:hypothetical protein